MLAGMTIVVTPAAAGEQVRRLWWFTLTRGIFSLALGLAALFWPNLTVSALFALFGVFTIIDGLIALGIGLFGPQGPWGASIFQGIAGLVIGILVLRFPQTVAAFVVVLLALWALVIGLFQVALAFRLRGTGRHWWWVLASGVITALLGLYFLINPATGVQVLAVTIGIFALLGGAVLVFGAFQIRQQQSELVRLLSE